MWPPPAAAAAAASSMEALGGITGLLLLVSCTTSVPTGDAWGVVSTGAKRAPARHTAVTSGLAVYGFFKSGDSFRLASVGTGAAERSFSDQKRRQ
jgi:hypothetical protein